VTDFVDALRQVVLKDEVRGEVFNIGNPQATVTVLGLAEAVLRMTHSKSRIVFKPHPGPEVEMRVPDIDRARCLLGFQPKVGLQEGLERSIAWYQEHLDN
jgi:nucleoside-diphosphate-sugar epimerase